MENIQTVEFSEKNQILELGLRMKAEKICKNSRAVPEVDVPQMVRRDIPGLADFLKSGSNIDPELVLVAKSVIRYAMRYYKDLVLDGFFVSHGYTVQPTPKKPGLDYYDNRRDYAGEYRTMYGNWMYDDKGAD